MMEATDGVWDPVVTATAEAFRGVGTPDLEPALSGLEFRSLAQHLAVAFPALCHLPLQGSNTRVVQPSRSAAPFWKGKPAGARVLQFLDDHGAVREEFLFVFEETKDGWLLARQPICLSQLGKLLVAHLERDSASLPAELEPIGTWYEHGLGYPELEIQWWQWGQDLGIELCIFASFPKSEERIHLICQQDRAGTWTIKPGGALPNGTPSIEADLHSQH